MATNEILQFAETDTGTNLLTQAEYLAHAQRPIGNQPGVARSKLVNKVLRQSSLIAAAVAQFIADNQTNNVVDTAAPADIADWIEAAVRSVGIPTAAAGGTADAITADFTPNVALANGTTIIVRAGAANATTTPTFAPDGLAAKTIVKGDNLALVAGDIAGAGHWLEMNFDTTLDKWVLQNPAVTQASDTRAGTIELATNAEAQALVDTIRAITPSTLAQALKGANQSLAGTGYQKLPGGLIIQWGITNLGSNLAGVGGASVIGGVTFPIAFPAGPLSASVAGFVPNSTGGEAVENFLSVQGLSATTLTVAATRVAGSGAGAEILSVAWICVGY